MSDISELTEDRLPNEFQCLYSSVQSRSGNRFSVYLNNVFFLRHLLQAAPRALCAHQESEHDVIYKIKIFVITRLFTS